MPSSSSCLQVTCGVLAVTIAILAGVVVHLSAIPSDIRIQLVLDNNNTSSRNSVQLGKSTATLTSQQIEDYHRDGVIFVRGLLSEEEATTLKQSANVASSRLLDVFGLFGNPHYKTVMFDLWRTSSDIASLSLQALPRVATQLMTTTKTTSSISDDDHDHDETAAFTTTRPNTASIRLLRDAFFAYQPPGEACGWHIDDAGFWPAVEDTTGPTFWIALDPLLVEEGGGLAVLNRTLFHETEPLDVTEDKCRKAIAGATCSMPEKSPQCHAKMEATKLQIDMRPGDAIVWDRFTFHRGVGGTDLMPEKAVKQRYSVRYMPKESRAFGAVHPSVEPMAEFNSPYYPQVWPKLLDSELKALEHGLDSDITLMSALTFVSKRWAKKAISAVFPSKLQG